MSTMSTSMSTSMSTLAFLPRNEVAQTSAISFIIDGKECHIRVFGTVQNPYFSGKDICEIMEIKDIKDTIQELVKKDHKKELKMLLQEQNNGHKIPNKVGGLKPPTSLGSIDLQNLSHNDGRLVVLSEPGVYDLLNGSRKDKNKKLLKNLIERFIYTIKYENNSGLMDIMTFISRMDLAIDIESDWFKDLWYPLSRLRGLLGEAPTVVDDRPFILTQSLLEWMGYKGRKLADKQNDFVKLLETLKIPYIEIDHEHPLAIEYPGVQNEARQLMLSNNLRKKKWICMDVKDFKKTVMRLNTDNADVVRDYYLNLEEAIFAYGEYSMMYMIEKERRIKDQLAIKEKSEEELKKEQEELQLQLEHEKDARVRAERKAMRVNKFMRRVVIKEKKLEWIYIATTKLYSLERLFKIGSTTRLSSRIGGYNTGRPKEDSYYYCWVKKCYNSKDLDYHIQKLLVDFKHRDNAELYCGIKFSDLRDIVCFIIDHYDESIDYINNFIRTRLDASLEEEDEAPPRLDYKRLTYQIGEHTETIDIEEEESESIKDAFEDILDGIREQRGEPLIVERKELISGLSRVTNAPKKDLWGQIKELTGWKDSKTEIDEGSFKYKITY